MIYTTIYWLVDTRPETIAAGWPEGLPFYCGMTKRSTQTVHDRLRKVGKRPFMVADIIQECGAYLVVRPMEVVEPLGGNRKKLRHWQERMAHEQQRVPTRHFRRNTHPATKHEAWLDRQRNVMLRSGKLPPPPY